MTTTTPTSGGVANLTAAARTARPTLNLTYYRLELRRIMRDKVTLFFTVGLPAVMYLIFGA